MANVARLGVVLGMDSAEFVKGLGNAKRELFNFQNALKGGAIAAFTVQLANWADQLSDTADAFDTTIGSVINLSEALQQSGGHADDAGKILGKFVSKLDDAANAGKEAQETFKKIGIGLKDIGELSSQDLFAKTIEHLSQIDDPVRRNAAAFDIFGKAIRGVDILKLNEELKTTNALTAEQESGIKDAADSVDMFSRSWGKLNRITAEYLGPLAKGIAQVFEDIVDGVERAIRALEELGTAFKNMLESIPRLPASPGGAGDEYDQALGGFIDSSTGGYTRKQSQTTLERTISNGRKVTPYVDKGDISKQNQLLKELATIEQITASYKNQLEYQAEGIQLQTDKLFMTQNEAQVAQVLYDLDKKRDEQIAQLQNKIDVAKETGADRKVIDALQQQIDKVNELTEAYKTQIVDLTIAQQNISQSYEGGWAASYQKYQEMAINNAAVVSQSVDALFNGMTLALTNFVRTGKFNFKDFANAIIADMIRIQMQAATSKLFSSLLGAAVGAFAGGVTGTPYTSEGLTSAGSAEVAGATMTITPIGNADGGDINAGQPYYVGENGPELIVPGRSGTIIPNNKLGGMNTGVTNITNNYIDAIDTKSFEDRLYGSSNAVWAANQYATKNISNSRTRS